MSLNLYEASLVVTCMDFASIPLPTSNPICFFVEVLLLGVLSGDIP